MFRFGLLLTASVLGLQTGIFPVQAIASDAAFDVQGSQGTLIKAVPTAEFNSPWAMTFLPDGRMLVSEKTGDIVLVSRDGARLGTISGVPETEERGQGGLGDVVLHPNFEENGLVYLSFIEIDGRASGAVVERAQLSLTQNGGSFGQFERIWTQLPKETTGRHYSHRMVFDDDGYLFITSGDRGRQTPSQDMDVNLGKLVRLHDDGAVPNDNPFAERGGIATQFWTVGHRNSLGIAFDGEGNLWAHEMGPRHGDELNRITPGRNYGWPVVSDGDNYSGVPIPDHDTRPEFAAPAISWVPAISPAGLTIYSGTIFPDWQGDAFIGSLSSQALVRVSLGEDSATEEERYEWGSRIRETEQGPNGYIWVLEDGGRLIRLEPSQ